MEGLLRDLAIDRPDQVWCADITYIPISQGFFYLVAVMDWATYHTTRQRPATAANQLDYVFASRGLPPKRAGVPPHDPEDVDDRRSVDRGAGVMVLQARVDAGAHTFATWG